MKDFFISYNKADKNGRSGSPGLWKKQGILL
jgi:hypothetical protein